jgi:hypothetical protein
MKSHAKKSVVIAAILGVVGITGLMLAHAQESSVSEQGGAIDWSSTTNLAEMIQAIEQVPASPADSVPQYGAYFSAQNPNWPPLPGNMFSVPVWNIGGGDYLLDDLSVDYTNAATEAVGVTGAVTAMSANASPMGRGFSPDYSTGYLTGSGGFYLTINQIATNTVQITVFNGTGPANYELWWTPILASAAYPWTAVAVGTTGQTNFAVNTTVYPTGFYQVFWDTNAIPGWEAANPNNPGAGILAVYIDSPTNGMVIQ